MQGIYRKRVNNLIAEIMLITGKRLGLVDRTSGFDVYDVNDNEIIASATTPQRLYGQLMVKRLELAPIMEDAPEVNPLAEFDLEDI